jgi:hypothetical protein
MASPDSPELSFGDVVKKVCRNRYYTSATTLLKSEVLAP